MRELCQDPMVQQIGSGDETGGGLGSVTLNFDPEDFDADQTFGFK